MRLSKYCILILSIAVSGCSLFGSVNEISITNSHTSTIFVTLWDLKSSNTVDPAPSFHIDADVSSFQINPTETSTLSKSEINGDSEAGKLRLFIFEVKGDSAFYKTAIRFSRSPKIKIRHRTDGFYIDT